MQWKDAIANIHKEHSEDTLIPLYTPWGEQIRDTDDYESIWQEYPRPQFQRDNYTMLNGKWDYCIIPIDKTSDTPTLANHVAGTANADCEKRIVPGTVFQADGQIRVPFSPESLLSGANKQVQPDEYLWYQRTHSFSQKELAWKQLLQKHCILHFDAVDYEAEIYVNGTSLISHKGGYLPFSVDITDYASDAPLLLQVRVRDISDTGYQTRGKQTLKRGGMFYTAQSGIWQSVWYEWVPENYITDYRITPNYDEGKVSITLTSAKAFTNINCTVASPNCKVSPNALSTSAAMESTAVTDNMPFAATSIFYTVSTAVAGNLCHTTLTLAFPDKDFKAWTPETPYLYPFTIEADEENVQSYFAMRSFTVEPDKKGIPRFHLNHKPYFLHGLLDQGYWSDGLMTAPCDKAFIYDIELCKSRGFNMLRKHIKIESLRWYYHCDRLGMIVWQDMVNGGTPPKMLWVCYMPTVLPFMGMHLKDNHWNIFSRKSETGRIEWEQECMDTVDYLYNVPSLSVWVPFNEGWGQFDAARIAKLVKEKDPTRPVDHASGWFDQKGGDFRSVHNYFRSLKVEHDPKRAFVISEYGGYACHVKGHSSVERIFGYKKYDTIGEMSDAYYKMINEQLLPLVEKGLSGAVYTQLSDVEEEVNGLVTYDRKVVKLLPET